MREKIYDSFYCLYYAIFRPFYFQSERLRFGDVSIVGIIAVCLIIIFIVNILVDLLLTYSNISFDPYLAYPPTLVLIIKWGPVIVVANWIKTKIPLPNSCKYALNLLINYGLIICLVGGWLVGLMIGANQNIQDSVKIGFALGEFIRLLVINLNRSTTYKMFDDRGFTESYYSRRWRLRNKFPKESIIISSDEARLSQRLERLVISVVVGLSTGYTFFIFKSPQESLRFAAVYIVILLPFIIANFGLFALRIFLLILEMIITPFVYILERSIDYLETRRQLKIALQDILKNWQQVDSLNDLASADGMLKSFPSDTHRGFNSLEDVKRRIFTISVLVQDYQTRTTLVGRLKVLSELRQQVDAFEKAMSLSTSPVSAAFQPIAEHWLKIIRDSELAAMKKVNFNALPNPFVAGHPLQQRDNNIFVGRRDIIQAIEQFILNTNQRPSLLLHGRRRTGKSSTLLNLPGLLSSQFIPIYIDCQDAKWHESDQAFCFNLANEIHKGIQLLGKVAPPRLDSFFNNAFTQLDQLLDEYEKLSGQLRKRILLAFDEYEGLEEGVQNTDITKNVLGKLRNIIQHRERIVVLVSGSHRFDELTGLNWASYLINTRTLELSFLDEAAARELLTQPVPKLQYEGGLVDEIIRITHCQPYLLQAVASELVNYLNDQQRTTATMDDLHVTIEKVLVSAGSYFANTWKEGRSDEEQAVMLASAMGEAVDWAAHPTALRNLLNAEIVEASGDGYQLTIDLFRRWILKHKAPVLPQPESLSS